MGFGSYDESDRENQNFDSDLEEDEGVSTASAEHQGDVEYEIGASNDELLERLQDIKDQ